MLNLTVKLKSAKRPLVSCRIEHPTHILSHITTLGFTDTEIRSILLRTSEKGVWDWCVETDALGEVVISMEPMDFVEEETEESISSDIVSTLLGAKTPSTELLDAFRHLILKVGYGKLPTFCDSTYGFMLSVNIVLSLQKCVKAMRELPKYIHEEGVKAQSGMYVKSWYGSKGLDVRTRISDNFFNSIHYFNDIYKDLSSDEPHTTSMLLATYATAVLPTRPECDVEAVCLLFKSEGVYDIGVLMAFFDWYCGKKNVVYDDVTKASVYERLMNTPTA